MINWKVRYAKVISNNPELFDNNLSILEVGSGNFGISEYLKRNVTGLEPIFSGEVGKYIKPVTGSILNNNFIDDEFDYVICIDCLEHLDHDDREMAIKEMIRIAKKKVILSFPCGDIAMWGDESYGNQLKKFGLALPSWLQEHIEKRLPRLEDITSVINQAGYQFDIVGNEGMMQHYAGILLDHFFESSRQLLNIHSKKITNEAPILDSEWDLYYSFLIAIDKDKKNKKTIALPEKKDNHIPYKQSINIYAAYHTTIPLNHFGDMKPISVGKSAMNNNIDFTDVLKDGTRLNNARWSELSGIFKIWKESTPSDYVGFCHYRRVFDLRCKEISKERFDRIPLSALPTTATKLNDTFIDLLNEESIYLPLPEKLNNSIFEHYHITHKINDLCLILELLKKHFPDLNDSCHCVFDSNNIYSNNMFISSWRNFDEICNIWFTVLLEFEKKVINNNDSRYQQRDISFLAERIFTIWINYKIKQGVNLVQIPYFHIDYPELNTTAWTVTE